MNVDQAYDVINRLSVEWPYVRDWPDDKTARWVQEVQALDYERACRALKVCIDDHQHAPAWSQFREAYRTVSWQALAAERQPVRPALPPAGMLDARENIRRIRELRRVLAKDDTAHLAHNHHRGAESCPICAMHDRGTATGAHKPNCQRCKTTGAAWYLHLVTPEDAA